MADSFMRHLAGDSAAPSVPSFVAVSTTISGFASTGDITLPTLLADDLILIHLIAASGTNATEASATGYTTAVSHYVPGNTFRPQVSTIKKVATGGDSGATVTVTSNAPGSWAACATVWRNIVQVRATSNTFNDGAVAIDPGGVTPTNSNDVVVFTTGSRSGASALTGGLGGFTGFTKAADNDNSSTSLGIGVYYDLAAGTSAVNPPAQTGAVEHSECSAVTYVLGAT